MCGPGKEVKSPNAPLSADGVAAVALEQSFDAANGSELRRALVAALDTKANPEDSDVQLVVMGVDGGHQSFVNPALNAGHIVGGLGIELCGTLGR